MTIAKSGFVVHSPDNSLRLEWEDIGEGVSGDYDPSDPKDMPLFRVYLTDAERLAQMSYCTLAVVGKATEDQLRVLSRNLFAAVEDNISRHVVEKWTWTTKT